jgi:hypothetical protein
MSPTSSFRLQASPYAPKEARTRMRHFLASERLADASDLSFLATLLTSELVNHAVEHDDQQKALTFSLHDSRLRVELAEDGGVLPWHLRAVESAPPRDSLRIIDAMAARWGAERTESGSAVWFELGVDGDTTDGDTT